MSLSEHNVALNHYMSQEALLMYMAQRGGTLPPPGCLSLEQRLDQAVVQACVCPECQGPLTYLPFIREQTVFSPARHLVSVAWCETCQWAKTF